MPEQNIFDRGGDPWDNLGQQFAQDPVGFMTDPGGFGNSAWSRISGGRTPDQVGFNQGTGQAAPAAQGRYNPFDPIQSNQTRDMQMTLIQQLQDQAAGRGPSLAQMQLQQGTDRNMAQAMALGASQRGAGAGGMLKGIQNTQAGMAQGMAGDAAMLRLQEQMAARGMLGGQLAGARGADMQGAQFNAGQQNQTSQFNAGQQNQIMDANAARRQQAAMEQAKLDMERQKLLAENAKQSSPMGLIGGIAAAFSDENLKTEIEPGGEKLYAFLDKLGSHDYKYKNPAHGEGRRISPMAQELEKSDLGREFVFEARDGKAVDYGKGFGTMLAAQAELHKRLKKLER